VFDGHGGAEVAKFCQKYMAAEMQQLRAFNDNVLEQSLVDVFHRMDEMLSDHAYADELEALKTRERDDDDDDDDDGGPGVGGGRLGGGVFGLGGGGGGMVARGGGHGGHGEGDEGAVTPMDALEMLKRVFQLKRFVASEQQREAREAHAHAQQAQQQAAAAAAHEEGDDEEGEDGGARRRRPAAAAAAAAAARDRGDEGDAMDADDDRPSSSSAAAAAAAPPPPPPPTRPLEPPGERVQAGCTAVVALKRGNDLYVANAGDSRAVLCRAGGQALALSEDHKPAHATERDRILAAGGFLSEIGGVCRVNGNLNLSRAIGDLKYKQNSGLHPRDQIITAQPDVRHVKLEPGKDRFLLLACDGVWDVMTNQEAVDFISARLDEGRSASQAACDLIDACLAPDPKEARGVGCDNMTAIVVLLHLDERDYSAEAAKAAAAGAAAAAADEAEAGKAAAGEEAKKGTDEQRREQQQPQEVEA
jgi:serine/threonine protein phosphatase PrpC